MMRRLSVSLFVGIAVDGVRTPRKAEHRAKPRDMEDVLGALKEHGFGDDPFGLHPQGPGGGGDLDPNDFAHCHLSRSDCSLRDMTEATLVYTDSDTSLCWNGDPFAFLVHPGRTDKLLYNYPGGGVCFDSPFSILDACKTNFVDALVATKYGKGVMAPNNPDNVVKDYTWVAPLYCGGGAHLANHTLTYDGWTQLYQYDYNNNEFAMSWTLANMDETLTSLVIMGSSAGSLGTVAWMDYMLSTFKYKKASVFMDSYLGILPGNTIGQLLRGFGACDLPKFERIRPECLSAEFKLEDEAEYVMAKYPGVAFGILSSKWDLTQLAFWGAIGFAFGLDDFPWIGDTRFYAEANELMLRYNQYPNFVSYFVDGNHHTFTHEMWYTATVAGKNTTKTGGKPKVAEWFAQLVNHEAASSQCYGPMKYYGQHWDTTYCDLRVYPKTLVV